MKSVCSWLTAYPILRCQREAGGCCRAQCRDESPLQAGRSLGATCQRQSGGKQHGTKRQPRYRSQSLFHLFRGPPTLLQTSNGCELEGRREKIILPRLATYVSLPGTPPPSALFQSSFIPSHWACMRFNVDSWLFFIFGNHRFNLNNDNRFLPFYFYGEMLHSSPPFNPELKTFVGWPIANCRMPVACCVVTD